MLFLPSYLSTWQPNSPNFLGPNTNSCSRIFSFAHTSHPIHYQTLCLYLKTYSDSVILFTTSPATTSGKSHHHHLRISAAAISLVCSLLLFSFVVYSQQLPVELSEAQILSLLCSELSDAFPLPSEEKPKPFSWPTRSELYCSHIGLLLFLKHALLLLYSRQRGMLSLSKFMSLLI